MNLENYIKQTILQIHNGITDIRNEDSVSISFDLSVWPYQHEDNKSVYVTHESDPVSHHKVKFTVTMK